MNMSLFQQYTIRLCLTQREYKDPSNPITIIHKWNPACHKSAYIRKVDPDASWDKSVLSTKDC